MHHRIGAALARLEGRIALEALLKRYSRIELAAEPVWRTLVNFRGVSQLRLRVAA